MACSCSSFCGTADEQFTDQKADTELRKYRKKGPGPTTRLLRDGLARAGLLNGALLDIGTGIGALTFELLDRGVETAIAIDASRAYLASAQAEAERRARSNRVRFVHADFVAAAADLPAATIVTLDRVVCCYPAYDLLLEQAVTHAERAFAFSYPRDRWYVRLAMGVENAMRSRKCPFRTFVHPPARMTRIIEGAGFELISRQATLMWSVDVFARGSR
jgi:magnesium-protoporphyrin O-methyltransferase